jgi:polyvinyl alcohol dehydrogenase (cytochrome)
LGHDLGSSFANSDERAITTKSAVSLQEVWSSTVQGTVNGTPAVVEGTVYALGSTGVFAFDASSGVLRWKNMTIYGTSSPTVEHDDLFIDDGKSVLHALKTSDGTELWQATIDPHPRASGFSSPLVADGLVIIGSASIEETTAKSDATFRGSLVAFDVATGKEVWRHYTVDPPDNGVAIWSSPSVDEASGTVYATTGNNYTGAAGATSDSIFALRVRDGHLVWNRQLSQGDVFTIPSPQSPDSDFGTNPILFDAMIGGTRRQLVAAGQKSGMFWALDRATGDVVWSRKVSGGSALIGGVFNNGAFDGQRLLVAGNNGTSTGPGSEAANGNSNPIGLPIARTSVLEALDPATGDVIWERQLPAWVWAPITVTGGVGFVSVDRELQAFNTATGERLWTMATAGTIASGAAIVDGRVYFGSGVAYLGTKVDDTLHALGLPAPQ